MEAFFPFGSPPTRCPAFSQRFSIMACDRRKADKLQVGVLLDEINDKTYKQMEWISFYPTLWHTHAWWEPMDQSCLTYITWTARKNTQMSIFDRIETQTLRIILALSKVESSSGLSIVIYSKSLCTLRHISRKRQKSNTNSWLSSWQVMWDSFCMDSNFPRDEVWWSLGAWRHWALLVGYVCFDR